MTPERIERAVLELDTAIAALTDGHTAQGLAHVRQARILLKPLFVEVSPNVWLPKREAVG